MDGTIAGTSSRMQLKGLLSLESTSMAPQDSGMSSVDQSVVTGAGHLQRILYLAVNTHWTVSHGWISGR